MQGLSDNPLDYYDPGQNDSSMPEGFVYVSKEEKAFAEPEISDLDLPEGFRYEDPNYPEMIRGPDGFYGDQREMWKFIDKQTVTTAVTPTSPPARPPQQPPQQQQHPPQTPNIQQQLHQHQHLLLSGAAAYKLI